MVEIIHEKGKIELDFERQDSAKTLQELILDGTPVLIETMRHNTASMNLYPTTSRDLFYSNGEVNGLSVKPRLVNGRAVIAHASGASKETNWGMLGYFLSVQNERSTAPEIVKSYFGTRQQYNEGTFSPAGGVSWTTFSSGGTRRIVIGKPVEDEYASELRAIKFVEGGLTFDLPSVYSMPGYLISQKGITIDEQERITHNASGLACVTASKKLVETAALKLNSRRRSKHGINSELTATQIGWWSSGSKMFVDRGYPVNDEDYAINELMHPSRLVGFVKVSKGGAYGLTFVYPTEVARETFELAFSDKFVKKYFPGMRR